MNKQTALKNAKDFIDCNFNSDSKFDFNKPLNVNLTDLFLKDDQNLEVLQSELNKIGFQIKPDNQPHWFIITKISK